MAGLRGRWKEKVAVFALVRFEGLGAVLALARFGLGAEGPALGVDGQASALQLSLAVGRIGAYTTASDA